jgi:hypothetical protein
LIKDRIPMGFEKIGDVEKTIVNDAEPNRRDE